MHAFQFRSTLCASLILLSGHFATDVFAQEPRLLAQQAVADEIKPVAVPPKILAIKNVEQYAAYWTSGPAGTRSCN
jgi:hypothetical protein